MNESQLSVANFKRTFYSFSENRKKKKKKEWNKEENNKNIL